MDKGDIVIETKMKYEVNSYPSYSSRLVGHTCGYDSGATELSHRRYETVEVLLYNFGDTISDFNKQISKAVEAFN